MLHIRTTVELKIHIFFKEYKAHQINETQMKRFLFYVFQRSDSLKPGKIARRVKYGSKHNPAKTKIDQTDSRQQGIIIITTFSACNLCCCKTLWQYLNTKFSLKTGHIHIWILFMLSYTLLEFCHIIYIEVIKKMGKTTLFSRKIIFFIILAISNTCPNFFHIIILPLFALFILQIAIKILSTFF